ncbi:MAG: hypothetical protein QOE61_2833 [Micromonosporaceae bacterium]|nr:hypothetical protein [Micromonosporaceae bacterium]
MCAPISHALAYWSASRSTLSSSKDRSVACWLMLGSRLPRALRARWSALLTDATVGPAPVRERENAGSCGAGSPDPRIRGLGKPVELVHPFIVGDLAEQIGD